MLGILIDWNGVARVIDGAVGRRVCAFIFGVPHPHGQHETSTWERVYEPVSHTEETITYAESHWLLVECQACKEESRGA